jgi:acetyl esterase/lipase
MPLDPHIARRIHLLDAVPDWDSGRTNPEHAAAFAEFFLDPEPYELPTTVEIRDETIDGPHGPIPVRIYRPSGAMGPLPALLWNHGGGFSGGDLEMNESHVTSAELAERAQAVVVAVDYRLANDGVQYPVPVDDVEAAWLWLVAHADELGVDAHRIALGGASAGANLAAATALRLAAAVGGTHPSVLLLAYPALHFPFPALDDDVQAVMATLPEMIRFHPQGSRRMLLNYAGRSVDLPPEVMPGHAPLAGFPATRILISEYDDIRPSGELFAEQLVEVGVPVETQLATGMLHGHLNRTPTLTEVDRSLDFFAEALAAPAAPPPPAPVE